MVGFIEDDAELVGGAVEELHQGRVAATLCLGDSLKGRDDNIVRLLDGVNGEVSHSTGNHADIEMNACLTDMPQIVLKAAESLIQEVVRVRQPEDLVSIGQRI